MRQLIRRLALIAGIVLVPAFSGDAAADGSKCTPGLAISAPLPELAFDPGTSKPYFVGVSSGEARLAVVSADGAHCRLEGTSRRRVDLHPFIEPGDADVAAPIPLATVEVDVALDLRPAATPSPERCHYADIAAGASAPAGCFHASQDPIADAATVAKWTARVRVIRTGSDASASESERTIWVNLSQLPGVTASTSLAQLVTTTVQFLEAENWSHLIGLFPLAVFAEGPHDITVTDPQGRQTGYLAPNDIPHSTYVTHGSESMIVIVEPEDGLYLVNMTVASTVRLRLSMARVDYSAALGRPLLDEIPGNEFHHCTNCLPRPRYAFFVTPPPADGASPYDRIREAATEALQFWTHSGANGPRPDTPAWRWLNEYRLSRTGDGVLKSQSQLAGELMAKKQSRQEREARSGRDPHALDALFDRLIATTWAASRELAFRGLTDASPKVSTEREAKRLAVAWQYFALADRYAADGDPATSIERYWYAFREVTFLTP